MIQVKLDILIKCYTHLQFNDYLFKAMLMHDKYKEFENDARNEYILTDERLLDIFNKSARERVFEKSSTIVWQDVAKLIFGTYPCLLIIRFGNEID
mgnify:CR=1 FL=1